MFLLGSELMLNELMLSEEELADLYTRRWRVTACFRSFKQSNEQIKKQRAIQVAITQAGEYQTRNPVDVAGRLDRDDRRGSPDPGRKSPEPGACGASSWKASIGSVTAQF